jgi:hypothetical protein
LLQEARTENDYSTVEQWIQFRSHADTPYIIEHAIPYSARLSPFAFFNFSDRAATLGDPAQADLWNMIARFRLRFDLLRCGMADGVEQGQKLLDKYASLQANYYREISDQDRRRLAVKVLEFDDAHPAANDPTALCKMMGRTSGVDAHILAKKEWESFREGIHVSTRMQIGQPAASPAPETKPAERPKASDKKLPHKKDTKK